MHSEKIAKIRHKKDRKLRYDKFYEHKLLLLLLFAVIYGLVFINFIDIITNGSSQKGYHLWLVLMYFLPFAILSLIDLKNWKLTLGLGLIVSLMNDVFYGLVRNLMGHYYNLELYYTRWLLPGDATLFTLNLGFVDIPVHAWMMAFSIYLRVAVVFILLDGWKYVLYLNKNWRVNFKPKNEVLGSENVEVEEPL